MLSDIVLESIKICIMGLILVYLLWMSNKEQLYRQQGWSYIILGFALLFLGGVFDITDNFTGLNKYVIIGDTVYQAFLEKVVGDLAGFILLIIGFW